MNSDNDDGTVAGAVQSLEGAMEAFAQGADNLSDKPRAKGIKSVLSDSRKNSRGSSGPKTPEGHS